VQEDKPILLIVEDDLDVADMLNAYFIVQGFEVQTANWGEDAVQTCSSHPPDLVILDIRLPDIDGFEVARRLRTNRRTQNIPIIFLTEKRARSDRLLGLELGADDYITKPFDVQELRLRVRNALSRSKLGTVTNPVTNLPEGALLDERLAECVDKDGWSIILVKLFNLEHFRDNYGFVASDDVLKAIGLMIANALRDDGFTEDYLGQLRQSEFVVVTTPERMPVLCDKISSRLEQSVDYFYPLKDRGTEEMQKKRIIIRLGTLDAKQGPFDLTSLKAAISKMV
jgi:PleD family two-component response regulator